MRKLVNQKQMKTIEQYTIDVIGIPSLVLMENAAIQFVGVMTKHTSDEGRILVVCGIGNNGGDGYAIARILANKGYRVDLFSAGDPTQMSTEAHQQSEIIKQLDLTILDDLTEVDFSNYTTVVDALFGIGLNGELEQPYTDLITQINAFEGLIFAVDMPSGLSADTGKVMGVAVKADYTVTFSYEKIGQSLFPASSYCGKLIIVDIGIPQQALEQTETTYHTFDKTDLSKLPKRQAYSNKGTFGKVLIIAGAENMSGAAFLSAKAAYRTGAGLVEILTPEANRVILQTQLPEAILTTYDPENISEKNEKERIKRTIQQADHVVIGPGISTSEATHKLLDLVTLYLTKPVVFDADAINLTANYYNTFPMMRNNSCVRVNELSNSLPPQSIVTPHLKELARLLDRPIMDIQENLLGVADSVTQDSDLIFVMKDTRTIVTYDSDRYINHSGNNGMATGGTGDVLTGIIAGLLVQGCPPPEAAKLGVYIHGLAGDIAAEKVSSRSLLASDVIEALGDVFKIADKS